MAQFLIYNLFWELDKVDTYDDLGPLDVEELYDDGITHTSLKVISFILSYLRDLIALDATVGATMGSRVERWHLVVEPLVKANFDVVYKEHDCTSCFGVVVRDCHGHCWVLAHNFTAISSPLLLWRCWPLLGLWSLVVNLVCRELFLGGFVDYHSKALLQNRRQVRNFNFYQGRSTLFAYRFH